MFHRSRGLFSVLFTVVVVASPASLIATGCSSSSSSETPKDSGTTADARADVVIPDDDAPACPPKLGTAKARVAARPAKGPLDDTMRMNQLQLKATHNSYHLQPDSSLVDWSYSHAPLDQQLESQGVRGVELDVHWDEACNRYRVFHIAILDPRSTCDAFTDCLQILRTWSDAHQGHHPIFVHIEPKDGYEPDVGEARFQALESEILSVWPRESIVTPDEVKGTATSLAAAVATPGGDHGWPTLGAARGRFVFYMDRSDEMRDAYTHGRKDLVGRLLFTDADATDPFAAMRILNDPVGSKDDIEASVKKGVIVRTFAEKSIESAKAADRTQPDLALAGAAQIISTDFPAKVASTSYFLELTGGTPSRCDALVAPTECTPDAVESEGRLKTP